MCRVVSNSLHDNAAYMKTNKCFSPTSVVSTLLGIHCNTCKCGISHSLGLAISEGMSSMSTLAFAHSCRTGGGGGV